MRLLDLEEKGPVYTQFLETVGGLITIRAFGWQKDLQEANYRLVDRSQKPFYLMFMIQRWLTLVLNLITMGLAVVVVGIAVGLRGSISPGFTGVALTQIISFAGYLKQTITYWTQLETSLGAVARIKQFSAETENENLEAENQEPPADWPSRGRIEYFGVFAAYE
jgi:ATP-binding cassette subfamily C (CFTR/MRP) protein 1